MTFQVLTNCCCAAREQAEPQWLLFVFATALPDESMPEQRVHFAAGAGGALAICAWRVLWVRRQPVTVK